ncbi:tetratricopeptide repeat protein [Rhodobaculum claviforme]|uniref:Tetratricopeptide repeat protein n=1 Tax=Rhodobaculum claviforme TaxID=1549854 RepID=A0A934TI18_9RHOB|nr:tetratricopeptide repeat protein [Rhodobaculum claviforme]MBK5925931.1 hypothetical protein [Rhodobaculum claviforme]
MGRTSLLLNAFVAASLALAGPAAAQDGVGALLQRLADPQLERWDRVERRILDEWSKSGSSAMDLLLRRGRAALEAGEVDAAIAHLTALTDHAPQFAEGWNARAAAFYERGDYGPAMEDLARALTLNPSHFGAMAGLGMILEETGREVQALHVYRAAQAIHPHQPVISRSVARLEARVSGRDT